MGRDFQFYRQQYAYDCGPACFKMVAGFYGKNVSINKLRVQSQVNRFGVNILGLVDMATANGMRAKAVNLTFAELVDRVSVPCILHYNEKHFVVLLKAGGRRLKIADPSQGIIKLTKPEFADAWLKWEKNGVKSGVAILMEPTNEFFEMGEEKEKTIGWSFLVSYLKNYKGSISQILFGLLIGSLLQLIFPFLTQGIVDVGINNNDINFINAILLAQFVLFFSRTVIDFIRNRLLLLISTKINMSLLSDFWIKLMKLPVSFFDARLTGDLLQRINDQNRVENFISTSALTMFFYLFTLIIFSFVLFFFDTSIFTIYSISCAVYIIWVSLFLKKRRQIDFKSFEYSGQQSSLTMQLVYGMQEIKLANAENLKRMEWEAAQEKMFKLKFKLLSLSQIQQTGAFFINEGKNILITIIVARAVVNGELSLGSMLAIQYIIGQLQSPIEFLVSFIQQAQDSKNSLDRLNDIHQVPDEFKPDDNMRDPSELSNSISVENLSFKYPGVGNADTLKNIDMVIPGGKTTAIVGMSGSGKTTLIKLFLKFYAEYAGEIKVGGVSLKYIHPAKWRKRCGVVMQDGFIFSDTIMKNIAVNQAFPDHERVLKACEIANILSFIESLPHGFNTKIGSEGVGLSAGQRQRILIARAVYKNPEILFFDEATNALDANNEKAIIQNLNEFLKEKTVVIVAHRLSTVESADNIIVLKDGVIVEQGSHSELSLQHGAYYELVRNQLSLGK